MELKVSRQMRNKREENVVSEKEEQHNGSSNTVERCSKCCKMILDRFYYISIFFALMLMLQTVTSEDIAGLYKPTDPIVDMNNDTWKSELMGHNKVWIVEFYSSWCGHCQAFAPKWVKLAVQLQSKFF